MIQLDTNKESLDTSIDICKFLLDEVGAYIYMKNVDKKYVYVNELTCKLFNQDFEQIIGYDDNKFFDFTDSSELTDNDTVVLIHGKTITAEEVNTVKSTGDVRVYRTVKKPIYNNHQKIIGLFGISTDITDIHNLKEELRKQAITDSLTGLYNRRFFLETAKQSFSESKRHSNPFSLIIIDIDLFKKVNDTFGHATGDAVITFIGECISKLLRNEDVLARVGGEEFAILLPHTAIDIAHSLAENIRSSISKQAISGKWEGKIHPKISLGVTSCKAEDTEFDAMYLRADSALYEAKHKGRNRVFVK